MAGAGASLNGTVPPESVTRISSLSIEGFKSIDSELTLKLQPLTILAGANSSGKSSAIQPLLLLKQTLEAPYDPGPLLLNGPNVEFTSVSQFLCNSRVNAEVGTFSIGGETETEMSDSNSHSYCKLFFKKKITEPVELEKQLTRLSSIPKIYLPKPVEWVFKEGLTELTNEPFPELLSLFSIDFYTDERGPAFLQSTRNRCFIETLIVTIKSSPPKPIFFANTTLLGSQPFEHAITHVIHVPGLRGNPKRNYPVTGIGDRFPGTFEKYVASVVAHAQTSRDRSFLNQLVTDLRELGLAWHIQAKAVDDASLELLVNRLPQSGANSASDLVSIADVGFGVSQTLPVVVALLTAKPGQLVFIEQPEIHLHPRAQVAMAGLLARAANRGVQVVIETHSSLLLLGIQRLVADETIDPAKIKLHWFRRNEATGLSDVTSGTLDPAGAFGDWPEDFDDVILNAQQQYLDAAEKKLAP